MLGTALVLILFLYTGHRISRLEGAVLLGGYSLYIGLSFTVYGP
jgi:cation:H+ antiporter